MAAGARPDDYAVMHADFDDRGAAFDALLDTLRATWRGEVLNGADAPIGPPPWTDEGPPIVLGGGSGAALRRVARHADAYFAPPAPAA